MANLQRVSQAIESACDALNAIISKALGYPVAGVHIGAGRHVDMPASWDGLGATPPGWTKHEQQVWTLSALLAALPMPDDLIPRVQSGPAQNRLTGQEIASLAVAIAGRVTVDLDGYSPKENALLGADKLTK